MAKFNEILVGRYNKALTKIFSMKGQAPAPQLASEITPAISMFYGIEHRIPESWDIFGVANIVAGAVGQTSTFRFRNPTLSGMIAVFEKLTIASQTAAQEFDVSVGPTITDLTGFTSFPRDGRGRPASSILGSSSIASQTALAGIIGRFRISTTDTLEVIQHDEQEIVITPGQGLQVQTSLVNSELMVTAFWRERTLEESETRS